MASTRTSGVRMDALIVRPSRPRMSERWLPRAMATTPVCPANGTCLNSGVSASADSWSRVQGREDGIEGMRGVGVVAQADCRAVHAGGGFDAQIPAAQNVGKQFAAERVRMENQRAASFEIRLRRGLDGLDAFRQRQREPEGRTFSGRAVEADLTAEKFDQALADGQAQSGAAVLPGG